MAQALPTNPPSKLDGEHYWDFVTFSVEGCLFRLPKYRFVEESERFCKEYDLDHGSLTPMEEPEYANIDEHPDSSPSPNLNQRDPVVKLEGVKLGDFRCFLKVLYTRNGEHELATFTPEQWGSVLKLSTKWFFNDIRHRAIKEIGTVDDTMSDVNRIVLAKEYGISEWLLAGYKALITREETIDPQEGEKIGLRNALQLYQLRDKYYRQGWDEETLKTETMWKFAVEIDKIQITEREYLMEAGRKAAEEEKARADEELEAAARARQIALPLSEKENARRKAVEQCEKALELKRQELAQMEKEKDGLLASASSPLVKKERKAIRKIEGAAMERAAATPVTSAGEPAVEAKSEESVVGTKEEDPVVAEEGPKVEQLLDHPAREEPAKEAAVENPANESKQEEPVEEPVAEVKAEEPTVETQAEEPVVETKAEPAIETVEQPVVETSAGVLAVEAKSEESVVGTKEEPVAAPKVEDPLSAEKQESTEAQIDGPVPEAKVEEAVTEAAPPAEPQLEVANADRGSEPSATEQVKPNGVKSLSIQTAPALNNFKANDAEGIDSPVVGPDSKVDERKARKKAEKVARKKAKKLAERKAAAAQETTAGGAKPSEEPAAEGFRPARWVLPVKLDPLRTQDLSKTEPLIDLSATPSSTVQPAPPPAPKNNAPSTPTTRGARVPLSERLSKPIPSAWPPISNSTNNGAWNSSSPSSAKPKENDELRKLLSLWG